MTNLTSHWQVKTLADVANIQKGSVITAKEAIPGEIPVIAGGKKPAYFHNEPNRSANTITVSASGAYAGYVAFHKKPIFASDCVTLQVKDDGECTIEFLFHFMLSKQDEIYALQRGSGMPHVYAKDLALIEVPLPPVNEQIRLVQILDEHLSRLDKAIAEMEEVQGKVAMMKKSLLNSAFTGGFEE